MTGAGFVWRLVRRELRSGRRLLLLTASVTAGVAALVAINSFTDNLTVSVAEQAKALMGADLSISGSTPSDSVPAAARLLDSLRRSAGPSVAIARSASFVAMAYPVGQGGARLVQVRTIDPGWPWYGRISTSPGDAWTRLQEGGIVVDPSLLSSIGARVGDTLALGESRFRILGTVNSVPGDFGLQTVFGARVFIATRFLADTRLLGFGARASWETFVRLPATVNAQAIARGHRDELRRSRLGIRTVTDDRNSLSRNLTRLGRYLGLVALAALLLGGLGVASAVHVFIRRRLSSIAVLRCLGATSRQLLSAYLIQALLMGLLGSLLGAAIGLGVQQAMPRVLADFIPVDVRVVPSPRAILVGIVLGIWTAAIFSLLPLLGIRDVPPLVTLRRDVEVRGPRRDIRYVGVLLLLVGSVVALASLQVRSWERGAWFAGAAGAALLALWLASLGLIALVRRLPLRRLPFLCRQGLANLHRPANQTVMVVLALGFGAFLLTTLFTVEHNLLRDLRVEGPSDQRPNLALIDIRPEQRALVDSILLTSGLPRPDFTPIVSMRIAAVKGRPVQALLGREGPDGGGGADSANRGGGAPSGNRWAFRREYRSTYRAVPGPGEQVTAGRWFTAADTTSGRSSASPAAISVERDLAGQLGVGLGDLITWDVQGVTVFTRVASLREVTWARFEPNFFVVFSPGVLERAPQFLVALVRVADPTLRGTVQRRLAERAANVASVDLGDVQRALSTIIGRIVFAIRFMALFSLATGAVVLIGAIAASRLQRLREGTLLRTLGATRGQVLGILGVEYAALGLSAAVVASGLAVVAGWGLARFLFEASFRPPLLAMFGLAVGLLAFTATVGLLSSLEVLRRPPLEILREE